MKIRFAVSAFISLWLAGSAYSAEVPPIKAGEKPIPDTTEAELWYGMDQAEKNIRLSPYIVHDKALNAYVKDITCRVAGNGRIRATTPMPIRLHPACAARRQ